MMDLILKLVGLTLFALMLPVIYRLVVGPTAIDQIVAANVIGTKTAVLLVVIGTIFGRVEMFVDFAIAYALLNFIGSLAVARFFRRMRNRSQLPEGVEKELA
jgi:multicomponent Na+:H+ antiporter subunit F